MSKFVWDSSLRQVSFRVMKSLPLKDLCSELGEALSLKPIHARGFRDGGKYDNSKKRDGAGQTVRQGKISSEVLEVISEALQQGPCQTPLLQHCGFEIRRVKMSSDLRIAYVLWRAFSGMERSAEKAVISKARILRSLVFERLNLPFSPTIRFQEDKPSQEMLALDEVFAKLKQERDDDSKVKQENDDQIDVNTEQDQNESSASCK